jgi:mRNA-degrading endonuclease YafQ of YafQ-DinJ toxin-antitoxin module
MKITRTTSYEKKERKFFSKRPELKEKYRKVLKLLSSNPNDPKLKLHKINRNPPVFSVSLTYSYRIILDFIFFDNEILLIDVGNHDEVYRDS